MVKIKWVGEAIKLENLKVWREERAGGIEVWDLGLYTRNESRVCHRPKAQGVKGSVNNLPGDLFVYVNYKF